MITAALFKWCVHVIQNVHALSLSLSLTFVSENASNSRGLIPSFVMMAYTNEMAKRQHESSFDCGIIDINTESTNWVETIGSEWTGVISIGSIFYIVRKRREERKRDNEWKKKRRRKKEEKWVTTNKMDTKHHLLLPLPSLFLLLLSLPLTLQHQFPLQSKHHLLLFTRWLYDNKPITLRNSWQLVLYVSYAGGERNRIMWYESWRCVSHTSCISHTRLDEGEEEGEQAPIFVRNKFLQNHIA